MVLPLNPYPPKKAENEFIRSEVIENTTEFLQVLADVGKWR